MTGPDALARTRVSLHGIAEGVLAGPQFVAAGTIRLRVDEDGISTVAAPELRLSAEAVLRPGEAPVPLRGTYASLAAQVRVSFQVPTLYADHAAVSAEDEIAVDAAVAMQLLAWFATGRRALVATFGVEPVLWPEHFDLAVERDEVTYGISLGDQHSPVPYAYVSPWDASVRSASRWFSDAPFGALRGRDAAPDADALQRFFEKGRERARGAQG